MGEQARIYMRGMPETAWITIGLHCFQSNSLRIMQILYLFQLFEML